jgi:hypothetical protein
VYLTVSDRYNPIDIRQYWNPENADETHPTKKVIQLSHDQTKNLLNTMKVVRIFVPELKDIVP